MTYIIIGDMIVLDPNATGQIVLSPDTDVAVIKIGISTDGRVEINRIEIIGKRTVLKGKIDVFSFWECAGYVHTLEEPLPLDKGDQLAISLLERSGVRQSVYVALYCVTR